MLKFIVVALALMVPLAANAKKPQPPTQPAWYCSYSDDTVRTHSECEHSYPMCVQSTQDLLTARGWNPEHVCEPVDGARVWSIDIFIDGRVFPFAGLDEDQCKIDMTGVAKQSGHLIVRPCHLGDN
jgi:hypothetical protein